MSNKVNNLIDIEALENLEITDNHPVPEKLHIFAPKDTVFFPGIIAPIAVSDDRVVNMINEVMQSGGPRMVGSFLKKANVDEVTSVDDVHEVGVGLLILRMMRIPDGTLRMIVQGTERIKLKSVEKEKNYAIGEVERVTVKTRKTLRLEALVRALKEDFETLVEYQHDIPEEFKIAVNSVDDASNLADLIGANINVDTLARQSLLAALRVPDRIRLLRKYVAREIQILKIGNSIQDKTKQEIEKGQREYYLRKQLAEIQKELGEDDDESSEVKEWQRKVKEADLPEEALKVAEKELKRLERMNPASAEYSVVTTYLDYLVTLPWNKLTEDHLDLKEAKQILDEDHYGLEDIKDRILEFLAVRKLNPEGEGVILCFAGPPGVGKTSLGKSIARSMGREFARLSLGGVRDEAEIRGHRRTYVGAMPGRILQSLQKVGSRNPVIMLDEIDKLVSDFRGDPASALLEVLDPAQNSHFSDHYIELEFDLSKVFFITTANYMENIPAPLWDRMEVIRLPGYIAREKVEIAKGYLLPRQRTANGLKAKNISFTDKALDDIVTYYTREAGVRNLERNIGKVCRKVAREIAENGEGKKANISSKNLAKYLGPQKITPSWRDRKPQVGVTNGLAYTPVGGTVLKIETSCMPGKGQLKITGQLGNVMKESANIAHSWIRAHNRKLNISDKMFTSRDIHLHVPAGATPKDGPSAGVTMTTSLASLLSGKKVRSDIAMTGEITLSGNVLPIGGLREKVVAANRAKINHVIIPWGNKKDLEEIPEEVRAQMEFHPVKYIDEVLKLALIQNSSSSENSKKNA